MKSQALSELTLKFPTGYRQPPVGHQQTSLIKETGTYNLLLFQWLHGKAAINMLVGKKGNILNS